MGLNKTTRQYYEQNGIHCACVIHGEYYPWEYVEKLYSSLQRHFSYPVHLHVWTEAARDVPKHFIKHELRDLGVKGPKKSWWYKMQLFNPKAHKGRLFYFDLDVVITSNLDWMLHLSEDKFWAVRDFRYLFRKSKSWNFNSSVMVFNTETWSGLWKKFKQASDYYMRQFNGDQDFVNTEVPQNHKGFLDWNKIKSFRWQVQDGGIDFIYRTYPNKGKPRDHIFHDLSIVIFHGEPKPHEITDDDVKRHWR